MRKIKIFTGVIILIGLVAVFYLVFLKKEKPSYSLFKVSRGNVVQEVSETGTVKKGEEINLSFKNSGRIEKIYVKVGDKIKTGEPLAKLEDRQLLLQLVEAQAALEVAQAQFNKLLAGASAEEIKLAETQVSNAATSLQSTKQNLEDVKAVAKENLEDAYEDALLVLDDAYLKAYNALETVKTIQITYFTSSDQASLKVKENKDKIESNLNQIKSQLDLAKRDPAEKNIDSALSETKKSLDSIFQALTIIRQICEEPPYRDTVSSTNKTSLDTHKSNINTVLTNVTNTQQTISSTKTNNTLDINTAQAKVSTAEGALQEAQTSLSKIKAPPRQEDLDLYQAKTKQAQAEVSLLKTQIEESKILSPTEGQITKIDKKEGETVQLTEPVLSLISISPFQIEVDIYEEDIIKVKVGDPVEIKLTALPNQVFEGKVIAIDPAEKIIEQIVYYEVTIDFEEVPPEIKPGMTADITIKTEIRENVLAIPEAAIEKKNGKTTVRVLKGKTFEERVIEIDLRGSNDLVEVISGIVEGEEIMIK